MIWMEAIKKKSRVLSFKSIWRVLSNKREVSKHVEATKTRSSSDLSNINLEFDREIGDVKQWITGQGHVGFSSKDVGGVKKKKIVKSACSKCNFWPRNAVYHAIFWQFSGGKSWCLIWVTFGHFNLRRTNKIIESLNLLTKNSFFFNTKPRMPSPSPHHKVITPKIPLKNTGEHWCLWFSMFRCFFWWL